MSSTIRYDELLAAADDLPLEQHAELIETLRHRLAVRNRERILADAAEGRAAFERGELRAMTVDEIMREIEK